MNKHCYRLIFNRARGLLQAVAETVSSRSKAGHHGGLKTGQSPAVTVTLKPLTLSLECGSNYPGDINEFHNLPTNDMNKLILTEKCMQESGFLNKDLGVCVRLKSQNYSACNSNVEIPKRSVETRLNSPYCKTYPESNYCAP